MEKPQGIGHLVFVTGVLVRGSISWTALKGTLLLLSNNKFGPGEKKYVWSIRRILTCR